MNFGGQFLQRPQNTSFKMKNLELKERLNQLAIDHLEDLVRELKDEVSTKLKGDGNTDETSPHKQDLSRRIIRRQPFQHSIVQAHKKGARQHEGNTQQSGVRVRSGR